MVIYIGGDHRGFALKEKLKAFVSNMGYEIMDVGAEQPIPDDDYPDYAAKVAQAVMRDPEQSRGVIMCGSGVGVDITANRFQNVRSALGINPDQIYAARHDDNVNILALASDYTDEETAKKMVQVFLSTKFASDERFARRVQKIENVTTNQ